MVEASSNSNEVACSNPANGVLFLFFFLRFSLKLMILTNSIRLKTDC